MNNKSTTTQTAASHRSTKAEIRTSKTQGRGLFAKESIAKGEIVSVRGGHIITRHMEAEMEKPVGYWGYPINDEFVLAPFTVEEVENVMMFLNHSCEPNVGILGQIIFVAMRDIHADEELCIDYAMFGADKEPMHCNCQSSGCRGLITDLDWQLDALQKKYSGYFSSYVQLKIDKSI
jgi:uncharacterized protein